MFTSDVLACALLSRNRAQVRCAARATGFVMRAFLSLFLLGMIYLVLLSEEVIVVAFCIFLRITNLVIELMLPGFEAGIL